MSDELIYLLLICGLLVIPRALQRFRIPAPLTCFLMGIAAMLTVHATVAQNEAVQLLATLGICSLFLFAGLEVNLKHLRQGWRVLALYISVRLACVWVLAWLAWRFLALDWQVAALLSLALLTPSTGFIIDSLDRFQMGEEQRFWITSEAIVGELLGLTGMFFVLQGSDLAVLGQSSGVLLALAVAIPLLYIALTRWIVPHAPGSEFSLLIMAGLVAAYVTEKLGVEYLVGAFMAGVIARQLQKRLPGLVSPGNLHAVKLFSSFFIPFFFLSNGAKVPPGALVWEAVLIGLALTAVLVPLRMASLWLQRRWLFGESFRSSLTISVALLPSFIFTLVLAEIMARRFDIPAPLFGGLMLYAALNTLIPSLILRRSKGAQISPLEPLDESQPVAEPLGVTPAD